MKLRHGRFATHIRLRRNIFPLIPLIPLIPRENFVSSASIAQGIKGNKGNSLRDLKLSCIANRNGTAISNRH